LKIKNKKNSDVLGSTNNRFSKNHDIRYPRPRYPVMGKNGQPFLSPAPDRRGEGLKGEPVALGGLVKRSKFVTKVKSSTPGA